MFRVAATVPAVKIGNVAVNVENVTAVAVEAAQQGARLVVTPELSLTGYTCGDLLHNDLLLNQAEEALTALAADPRLQDIVLVVGAPLRHRSGLYNCAVALAHGAIQCVVPKCYIPNYNEFYEKRWFASGSQIFDDFIAINGQEIPFGVNCMIVMGNAKVGIEVCEDLWVPIPPGTHAALAGANVIVNLSASTELVGKHDYLLQLISNQSARTHTAYVYAGAGYGESTTDVVLAGNAIIAENGALLQQSERFATAPRIAVADVDLQLLDHERITHNSFNDNANDECADSYQLIDIEEPAKNVDYSSEPWLRPVNSAPFVPGDKDTLNARCEEIVQIQTIGLMRRLEATGIKRIVVGVSGGLDSTLALMIAVRTFDKMGLDRKGIYGITMPGYGTSGRTFNNATRLMKELAITVEEISIVPAVEQHFKDIKHDKAVHDVTYENSQARERTQILMDYANKVGALVLGTGDLSELALGWATYNGDHMSMYNVNVSIPKTLARHLISWIAAAQPRDKHIIQETLLDVLDTPVSPELTPADEQGQIAQKTEDIVGPYELHDFFLFNMLRYGFTPAKIYRMACVAFEGEYTGEIIKKWFLTFTRRFFSQQFKRSCLPDGPKVGSVTLSPRGDWRMPSDMGAAMWLNEVEKL